MKNKLIVVGLIVVLALVVSYFLIDNIFLYPAIIAAMILMHLGMHGLHSAHK